jgi:HSP20 family protein
MTTSLTRRFGRPGRCEFPEKGRIVEFQTSDRFPWKGVSAMVEVKEANRSTNSGAKGQTTDIARGATTTTPVVLPSSPFAFMRRFAEEMDHLFEDFGLGFGRRLPSALTRGHELLRREAGLIPAEWSPRVDILQRDGNLLIRAELPGLSKEDIKVEVTGDTLTIQGERKQETKEEREGYCYREGSYGSFFRAIPLPEGADASKATAEFRNGVLEVAMPAPPRPESKARRLEVREGK